MRLLIVTTILLLGLQACNPVKQAEPVVNSEPCYQRFIPIASPTPLFAGMQPANFALDTSTGQLCKTWDWVSVGSPRSEVNGLPECRTLAQVARKPSLP